MDKFVPSGGSEFVLPLQREAHVLSPGNRMWQGNEDCKQTKSPVLACSLRCCAALGSIPNVIPSALRVGEGGRGRPGKRTWPAVTSPDDGEWNHKPWKAGGFRIWKPVLWSFLRSHSPADTLNFGSGRLVLDCRILKRTHLHVPSYYVCVITCLLQQSQGTDTSLQCLLQQRHWLQGN